MPLGWRKTASASLLLAVLLYLPWGGYLAAAVRLNIGVTNYYTSNTTTQYDAATVADLKSRLYNKWIIVPEHKLLFCFIEKVGCTSFNELFRSLRSRYDPSQATGNIWGRNNMTVHGLTEADIDAYVEDPLWHKAVFFREPLVRFLSAFRSKCEPHDDPDRQHCTATFGSEQPPFATAVDRLRQLEPIMDEHWRRQVDFCGGLQSKLVHFQTVEQLDASTSRQKVGNLLRAVGVSPESVPAFDVEFPPTQRVKRSERQARAQQEQHEQLHHHGAHQEPRLQHQTQQQEHPQRPPGQQRQQRLLQLHDPLAQRSRMEGQERQGAHETYADQVTQGYYSTPGMACQVVHYYLDDYLLFGIALPNWLQKWGFPAEQWRTGNCSLDYQE